MNAEDKVLFTLNALESQYHNEARPPELGHDEPLDGLILTVLSQNTNDKNRDAAFSNLRAHLPAWHDVISAGPLELEQAIRTAGLARTKSARIIAILSKIYSDFGEYSIKKMASWPRKDISQYLRELPGVGAKTVACTLLFDFKIPAFPVDTHIARISHRAGISPMSSSPEEISVMLEGIVPAGRCLGGHVNMIAHGRAVCHARKPRCNSCVLGEICSSYML